MAEDKDYSGELTCRDGLLSYKAEGVAWTIKVSDIRLIAEYTTSDGPCIDDYFFVFLTVFQGGWYEASFYARGSDVALEALGESIGAPLLVGLCDSAHYKTRIMWPLPWKDQELMKISPPKKTGWWARLLDSGARDVIPSKAMREVFSK